MLSIEVTPLPAGALLEEYAKSDAYTDCYSLRLSRQATLAEFMAAFYTTPVFKLERWLLSKFLGLNSTDQQAHELAQGKLNVFAAWKVQAREGNQAILAAGRTRSWLMVTGPAANVDQGTTLFFGSAVLPSGHGGLGWRFSALLGFHKLYSRVLLRSAARQLSAAGS